MVFPLSSSARFIQTMNAPAQEIFPLELIDLILNSLALKELKTCSLVAKTWKILSEGKFINCFYQNEKEDFDSIRLFPSVFSFMQSDVDRSEFFHYAVFSKFIDHCYQSAFC